MKYCIFKKLESQNFDNLLKICINSVIIKLLALNLISDR